MTFMGMLKGYDLKKGYRKLQIGMPLADVLKLFGQPDSVKVRENIKILGWWSREFQGWARGGSIDRRVTVEIQDDKVVGYDGENIDASIL